MVTLTLSSKATGVGTLPMLVGGESVTFPLGDGEVFQLLSGNSSDDLSGTEISTSQPVAVFSGNMTTTYTKTADNVHSPDMAHEQMPPVYAWSNKYVGAALPPQAGACDTLLGSQPGMPPLSIWRFIVWGKPSRIEIVDPSGKMLHTEPAFPPGEVLELILPGDFVVTSKEPLLMTQGIDCEPSLSLAISVDRAERTGRPLDDLTFAVLPLFDQVAAVVRRGKDVVTLDGDVIPDSMFTPAGGGYEVARVPMPECVASQQVCTHRLHGLVGMTMRGMDISASYALTVPVWGSCIDSSDPLCNG